LVALSALPHAGVEVVARSPDRAARLAQRLGVAVTVVPAGEGMGAAVGVARARVERAGMVINATPIGQRDDAVPLPAAWLAPGAAVLDLVYAPGGTAWVRACRALGHQAEDGSRMLVEQGALAFAAWFGVQPDRAAMWAALERA
jgi:shikimate dehydrogenase